MDSTTGKIDRNSQTANAISLSVGLVDAQDTARIMRNLIEGYPWPQQCVDGWRCGLQLSVAHLVRPRQVGHHLRYEQQI